MRARRLVSARRRIAVPLVLGLCALGVAAGVAVEQRRGEQWQATSTVLVQFWAIEPYLLGGQVGQVTPLDVVDAAAFAESEEVLDLVVDELDDGRDRAELADDVTATAQTASHAVSIVAGAPDPESARATAEAVADAMSDSLQERIDAASSPGSGATPELQDRAAALSGSLQPLQDLGTGEPSKVSPTAKTPVALGIVGFAAGSLLVIGMTFAGPTLLGARDAQRLVHLPTVSFHRSRHGAGEGTDATRLVHLLFDERPVGSVLVVPVRSGAEEAAERFLEWARESARDDTERKRLVLWREPTSAVLGTRPDPEEVAAVLLVVPRGTTRNELTDAVGLLRPWRAPDAVVFDR